MTLYEGGRMSVNLRRRPRMWKRQASLAEEDWRKIKRTTLDAGITGKGSQKKFQERK